MLQNLVGAILEDIVRLLLIDIKPDTGEFVHPDALNQVCGFDKSTAGGVDKNDAVLHLADGVNVDHVVGGIHERAVE